MAVLDYSGMNQTDDLHGKPLIEDGQYHAVIELIDESPENYDRNLKDGIEVKFQILAGTVPGQEKRTLTSYYPYPNSSHKDGGKFSAQKLCVLTEALGLTSPADRGRTVELDWQAGVGRQVIIGVQKKKYTKNDGTEGKIAELSNAGCAVFHWSDPTMEAVPKNAAALAYAIQQQPPQETPAGPGGPVKSFGGPVDTTAQKAKEAKTDYSEL